MFYKLNTFNRNKIWFYLLHFIQWETLWSIRGEIITDINNIKPFIKNNVSLYLHKILTTCLCIVLKKYDTLFYINNKIIIGHKHRYTIPIKHHQQKVLERYVVLFAKVLFLSCAPTFHRKIYCLC